MCARDQLFRNVRACTFHDQRIPSHRNNICIFLDLTKQSIHDFGQWLIIALRQKIPQGVNVVATLDRDGHFLDGQLPRRFGFLIGIPIQNHPFGRR